MSDTAPSERRDRLEALLPFFLNGTLSGTQLREVEDWLASDPEAVEALMEVEAEYSATVESNHAIRPPADALRRFSAALDKEAGPEKASVKSWRERFANLLPSMSMQAAWIAAGVALAIIVAQMAWINLDGRSDYSVAGSQSGAPFVFVTFREDAPVGAVSEMLETLGLEIDAGPLPGGVYRVIAPAEDNAEYDAIIEKLKAAATVEDVLDGRRPDDR